MRSNWLTARQGTATVLTSLPPTFGLARAAPSTVEPGQTVTITASIAVIRRCSHQAELLAVRNDLPEPVALLGPTAVVLTTPGATWRTGGCPPGPSGPTERYTLPVDLQPGRYLVCLAEDRDARSCAPRPSRERGRAGPTQRRAGSSATRSTALEGPAAEPPGSPSPGKRPSSSDPA